VIRISSFRPDFFNNNGDQGNISVLSSQFEALGVPFEITQEYVGSDFLLVGDSSIAAHSHFEAELLELLPEIKMRHHAGKPTLLVGRSFEFFAPHLGVELKTGERESKFVKLRVQEHEVFGYHNSTVLEPRLLISGAFIGTTLFGPLLAKNPTLLKLIANSLGVELKGDFFEEGSRLANLVKDETTF